LFEVLGPLKGRTTQVLNPYRRFSPALRALAYNPSDGIPISRGQSSPPAEAMEENKVVHERILEAIKRSQKSNSAKFGEVRRSSTIIEVLHLLSYLK
jgi:hypothetical protein